jgi:hypothetical protein
MSMRIYTDQRPERDDRPYLPIPDCYTEEQARARFVQRFGVEPETVHHFDGYWWPGPCPQVVTQ